MSRNEGVGGGFDKISPDQQFSLARQNPEHAWKFCGDVIRDVYNTLQNSYGPFQVDLWKPTEHTVTFHSAEGFLQKLQEFGETAETARNAHWFGFATVREPRKVAYDIESAKTLLEFQMGLAHEMMHAAWGLQKNIDFSELTDLPHEERVVYGRACMETFVSYLAYKPLGIFDLPEIQLSEEVKGHIAAAEILHFNIGKMPNAIENAFELCRTGKSEKLDQLIDETFPFAIYASNMSPHMFLYYAAAVNHLRGSVDDTEFARELDSVREAAGNIFFIPY